MNNLIFGDLGGYVVNRTWDNAEFRLDTPESELQANRPKSPSLVNLAGLGRWVQGSYHNLFNSSSKKTIEEGKAQS